MSSEPESHRLDREAMLAEHVRIAERVQREVDAILSAAAAKRRIFLEKVVDRIRIDAALDRERAEISRTLQSAASRGGSNDRMRPAQGAPAAEPEVVQSEGGTAGTVIAA